jgi:hypothetical protein
MVSDPSLLSCGVFLTLSLLQAFPLLGVCCHSCLLRPACLFTALWGIATPSLFDVQGTPPSLLHVFLIVIVYYSVWFFSFLPGWGRSVQGAMLSWPRVFSGSTMCHLAHLVVCISWAGRSWCLVAREPSWFLCFSSMFLFRLILLLNAITKDLYV